MKNLYIIYGCNKYWSRLEASKNTWMRNIGPDEDYVILGEISIPELKMVGFASDNGQYLNLGIRTLMFLDQYSDFLKKWDWITFVDDDAYLFTRRLRKKFKEEDDELHGVVLGKIIGSEQHIEMNRVKTRFSLIHGGATISLNKVATNRMLDYLEANKDWLFDRSRVSHSFASFGDVCVSYLCRKTRSRIVNCPFKLSYTHHKFNGLKYSDYRKIISSHRVGDEDKKKLYEFDMY